MDQTDIFLLVALSLSSLLHALVGWRLLGPLRLRGRARAIAWFVVALLAILMPSAIALTTFDEAAWTGVVQVVGFVWMGLLSIVLAFVLVRDALWLGYRLLERLTPDRLLEPLNPSRRLFVLNASGMVLSALTAVVGGIAAIRAAMNAEIVEVDIPIDGLDPALEGFRIAQISDIHASTGGVGRARVRQIVEAVNGLEADMVALTGDLVDGTVAALAEHVAPIAELRSRHGTWFVTGNHEYYSGAEPWCQHAASALRCEVLLNDHRVIDHDGAPVLIAGVTDLGAGEILPAHASDPQAAAAGAPTAAFKLLLAHQPDSIHGAQGLGFDLQLSGHTHAGQYFPYTWLVYLLQSFVAGLYRVDATWLYVNRGTTWWGPPMRLGAAPEITLLRLTRA